MDRLDSPAILSILSPMTGVAEKLRTELTKLDDAERGELAHFLIQSLDPSCDEDAESAWDVELERRADEIRNGQAIGVPADKVFSEILAKHS
jgi:putative addiction module component (TIGR02574 family)